MRMGRYFGHSLHASLLLWCAPMPPIIGERNFVYGCHLREFAGISFLQPLRFGRDFECLAVLLEFEQHANDPSKTARISALPVRILGIQARQLHQDFSSSFVVFQGVSRLP